MPHSQLRHVLVGSTHISRDQITWRNPIITAVIAGVLVWGSLEWGSDLAVFPLALGAVFTGLANIGPTPIARIKSMGWGLLWITVATLGGGLVAALSLAQVPVAATVALLAGFAGALGKRGALIGVLSLVLYTVFAGAPDTERTAVLTALLLFIGGGVQLLIGGVVNLTLDSARAPRPERRESVFTRLAEHRQKDDLFARHAIRLAVAIAVATALGQTLGWPHEYWIPMTVAWMSRPDKDGTTSRVVERVVGTVAGIMVSIFLLNGVGTNQILTAVYVLIGALLLLAFINANYPVAVTGITLLVLTLFAQAGEQVSDTAPYRIGATLIAGLITVAASFLVAGKPRGSKVHGEGSA